MRKPWPLVALVVLASCNVSKVTFTPEPGGVPPDAAPPDDAPPDPGDAPSSAAPRVVLVTSSVADATYGTHATLPIVVRFDAAVTVTGTPQLHLDSGAPPIPYTSGTGTTNLTFTYTVALGDAAAALDYTDPGALTLEGATITGEHGDAELTLPAPGTPSSLAGARHIAIVTGTTTFAYTGAMKTFVVPDGVTSIQIDAAGAQGGMSTGESGGMMVLGGKGARAVGTFAVTGGDQLSILVGGIGANSNCGSGGGGGSWAVKNAALLLVAGGGGGGFHCNALGAVAGVGGNTTPDGGGGSCTPARSPVAGGKNGAGGTSYFGGGGGGWLTAGTQMASAGGGGGAYPGAGGTPGGGYGGGGGYYTACCGGSGGGGGYSGGSGGTSDGCAGGGGGSLNMGTQPVTTADTHAGAGQVIVTW